MKTQTVTLPTKYTSNARNMGVEKETLERKVVVAYHAGEIYNLVDARWYSGRSRNASVIYCSVWCHHGETYFSGCGYAGGYGYHKGSAALDSALRSAGVTLGHSIAGVGDSAEDEALLAVARAMLPEAEAMRIV